MCKYEKECYGKRVERVITKHSDISEEPCERNDLSCETYRIRRASARSSVLFDEHQLKIAS